MSEAIVVAIITGACAIISQVVISIKSTKELYAKLDKQSELADAELKTQMEVLRTYVDGQLTIIKNETSDLRKAVEKHNGVVERMYKLESDVGVQKERITALEKK